MKLNFSFMKGGLLLLLMPLLAFAHGISEADKQRMLDGGYLIGGLPLIYIAFQELGWVNTKATDEAKRHAHAICVALFLIFGHIAMIAGMLDPSLLGYVPNGMSEDHNH